MIKLAEPNWPPAMKSWEAILAVMLPVRQQLYDRISELPVLWEDHIQRNPEDARAYGPLLRALWWRDQMQELVREVLEEAGFTIHRRGGHMRAQRGDIVLWFKKLYSYTGRSSSKTINSDHLEPAIPGVELPTVVVVGYVADQYSRLIKDIMFTVPLGGVVLKAESCQMPLDFSGSGTVVETVVTVAKVKVPKFKKETRKKETG
jgi:hypothetical protein